jgi:hypothetical protein
VGATADARARWLLTFARREPLYDTRQLAVSSEADALALRWEAIAFAKGTGQFTLGPDDLPSWAALTTARHRVWTVILAELRHGRQAEVEARWRGALAIRTDGRITGSPLTGELPFLDAFLVQAFETLAGLARAKRGLRFCLKCKGPFVARGRQLYDSATCSQSHRTALYRSRHREEFRAYRRAHYLEHVAKKLNKKPEKVHIQPRERRAP